MISDEKLILIFVDLASMCDDLVALYPDTSADKVFKARLSDVLSRHGVAEPEFDAAILKRSPNIDNAEP